MSAGLSAEVTVVGGGPAGSAAAISLARLGRDVVLVDKATFPRDKCCGDGLTTAALRRLEHLGLDPRRVASWEQVGEVVVTATDGRSLAMPFPTDGSQYAASAKRADLDWALLDLAAGAGVRVLQGHALVDVGEAIQNGSSEVTLHLDDATTVTSRYVVGADGMWSPLRKLLGLSEEGYLGDWQAGRQYYRNVGPLARRLWVWFEPDMVPGYAWSFPLSGGGANVGYGVLRPDPRVGPDRGDGHASIAAPSSGLRGQRIDLTERPHIAEVLGSDARPEGPWKSWPIPARIGAATLSGLGGRVLFVGDAARASDPMTGEGIAQALETGELAARYIATAGPLRPELAARRYRRALSFGLTLDDRLSRRLSGILAHQSGSVRTLNLLDGRDWLRRNFVRWMFEDYPRTAFVTPYRWRRGLFSSPGAFSPVHGPPPG